MALPEVNLTVDVVAADRVVWTGEAVAVLARTVEGDIGILRNHEPLLAVLVPCAAEIERADGGRQIIGLDGGFISVADNHVSLLSQYARLVEEIAPAEAERLLADAQARLNVDPTDVTALADFAIAQAQIKAVAKRNSSKQ